MEESDPSGIYRDVRVLGKLRKHIAAKRCVVNTVLLHQNLNFRIELSNLTNGSYIVALWIVRRNIPLVQTHNDS
jgi:hypothetical protein